MNQYYVVMAVDPSFDLAATLKEKLLAGEVIL